MGIVRVSGKKLAAFSRALCVRVLQPRVATYLPLNDKDAAPIDQVLALYFQGPNSYTGEDVLELQAHGGPVVLQMIVARGQGAGGDHQCRSGYARRPDPG